MTLEEFNQAIVYLRESNCEVLIEAEMPSSSQTRFENIYSTSTGGAPLPARTDCAPYYVWEPGANKWGVELRLYFVSDPNIPNALDEMCVNNNRPGYERYDKRINNNEFIYDLFENGFVLGEQV